jgi:Flp pilus assembly protein TadD
VTKLLNLTRPSAISAENIRITMDSMAMRPRAFPLLVIMVVTGWVFLPALQNEFVDWGDKSLIDALHHRDIDWSALTWMFTGIHFGKYEPITWLTFGLDHFLWWADPFGYHWTNLLLHMANAAAVHLVAFELFLFRRSGDDHLDHRAPRLAAAGLAALVFAIHPLRVEPVAWASARSEILAVLFLLCSVLFYVHHVAAGQSDRRKPWWMSLSVSAYGLSLLSGTGGIAFPVVLLVLDHYPLGRLRLSKGGTLGPEAFQLYKEKYPYLLMSLAAISVVFIASYTGSSVSETTRMFGLKAIAEFMAAPGFQLWKTVMPFALSPVYELQGRFLLLSAVTFLALFGWIMFVAKRWPYLLASCVCYLLLLWLVPQNYSFGAGILSDRRTYLSCVPWAILAGAAVLPCWEACLEGRLSRRHVILGAGMTVAVLCGLGLLTSAQTRAWRDSETLWETAAAASRSSKAHYNFAVLQEKQGKYDGAIHSYRRALEMAPQQWDAHERAGMLLQKKGKITEAVEHFRSAVQFNPRALEARENLAAGLVNLGHINEAVQHFRELLELAPERNETRVKLGTILAVEGRAAEATDLLKAAAKVDPTDGRIALRLGQVLAAHGELGEAVHHFREATRLRHEDAEAHESLGRALAELGKRDEAAAHLREALRILRSTPAAR